MRSVARRAVTVSVLVVLLTGMIGYYDTTAAEHDQFERSAAAVAASGDHVGQTVYLWATVERANDGEMVVRVGDQRVVVTDVETTPARDDAVQIYGTIRAEDSISARRVIVSDQQRLARMIGVSVLGFLLTVALFCRHWRIDVRNAVIEPREDRNA